MKNKRKSLIAFCQVKGALMLLYTRGVKQINSPVIFALSDST